jgi:hypothetical protein
MIELVEFFDKLKKRLSDVNHKHGFGLAAEQAYTFFVDYSSMPFFHKKHTLQILYKW